MLKKILNVVFNNFVNDVRVFKIVNSFLRGGYDVEVVVVYVDGFFKKEIKDGFKVMCVELIIKNWFKVKLV